MCNLNAKDVGERIAELRSENKLTQKQLAEQIHVTDKAVSKWERGLNYPDLNILEPLASALGTTPAELLGLNEKSSNDAILAGAELHKEERLVWLKELRNRAWTNLFFHLLIFAGLLCISKYMDDQAFYGYPMSLTGAMNGLLGTLIGYSIWTIRTSCKQLRQEQDRTKVR